MIAGYWFFNRSAPEEATISSLAELAAKYGDYFSGMILNPSPEGLSHNWKDFEIIIPRHTQPKRIVKVLNDRKPNALRRAVI